MKALIICLLFSSVYAVEFISSSQKFQSVVGSAAENQAEVLDSVFEKLEEKYGDNKQIDKIEVLEETCSNKKDNPHAQPGCRYRIYLVE